MKEDKQKLVFISILVLVVLVGVVLFLFNNKKGIGTINSVSDIKSMIKTIYKQVDLPELATSVIDVKNEECYQELKDLAEKENLEFYQISSATGDGVQELIDHVANVLKTLPKEELVQVETG